MNSEKMLRLETTVAALQKEWGAKAVQRFDAKNQPKVPSISTGFPALDGALAAGGIPRGRITEIIGIPTAGLATIALQVAANAQREGGTAIYLDLVRAFDPDYAADKGVSLDQLVLVRPDNERQALDILQDLIIGGSISSLIFDVPFQVLTGMMWAGALSTALGRLMIPLGKTECALVFLTSMPAGSPQELPNYPPGVTLPHYATVRLLVRRSHWIYRTQDIVGYRAQVRVVKDKLGRVNNGGEVAISFDGLEGWREP